MTPKKGFYTEKIINKFYGAFCEAKERLNNGEEMHVHFSKGNRKMGAVDSVSLPPFITCPSVCANTCGKYCYAAKIANLYANVLSGYAENMALAMFKPSQYWEEIRSYVRGCRFFRFHVSGDFINRRYFGEAVETAKNAPWCEFLAFTKRFDFVNEWISNNGDLPKNFHVLFSGEENLTPDNPHSLPETTIYEKGATPCEDWKLCGGNCFECGCRGVGCWQLQRGDVLAFEKH